MPFGYQTKHSNRPFVSIAYVQGNSRISAQGKPTRCPKSLSVGCGDCKISLHSHRKRVFGPGFSLDVYFCTNHECYFTAYPKGWVPYGRQPLVSIDVAGREISITSPEISRYFGTIFSPVVDAAEGIAWPEMYRWPPGQAPNVVSGCFRNQLDSITKALKMLGLLPGGNNIETVAHKLGIDTATIAENRRILSEKRARDGPLDRLRRRGAAAMTVLKMLPENKKSFKNLLDLGTHLQYWPPRFSPSS